MASWSVSVGPCFSVFVLRLVRGHATEAGIIACAFDRVLVHPRSHIHHHMRRPAKLQETLSDQISNYAWQFDARRVAKMLSATDNHPPDPLVEEARRSLEGKAPPVWPTRCPVRAWNAPIAQFLNDCVDVCHQALDEHPWSTQRDSRFYGRLNFIAYEKRIAEGIDGELPLKPDVVGGLDLVPGGQVAWKRQNTSESIKQALIPVEVGTDWRRMVAQAAVYARCLFSVTQSRQFALIIGFLPGTAQLRFLVFHRSGLTASKPCSVNDPWGRRNILRMFLSILEWTSLNDAGFLEFFNGFEMSLLRHEGDKTGELARVTHRLYSHLHLCGHATETAFMDYATDQMPEPEFCSPTPNPNPCRRPKARAQQNQKNKENHSHTIPTPRQYLTPVKCPSVSDSSWLSSPNTNIADGDCTSVLVKYAWYEDERQEVQADLLFKCTNSFGTPRYCYSFCPTDSRGKPMSTARFLPTDGENLSDFHWPVISSRVPSSSQCRFMWFHVSKAAGKLLVHAKTPWELYLAIGHAMLGWLSMMRVGFTHRGIENFNVLMSDPPATMEPFETWDVEELATQFPLRDTSELAKHVGLLKGIIEKLGSPGKCCGFVIDGETTTRLVGNFRRYDRSGDSVSKAKPGSMSFGSLAGMHCKTPHVGDPIGELESFYYVALLAATFNEGASGGKYNGDDIQDFRKMITDEFKWIDANGMVWRYPYEYWEQQREGYGPFFVHSMAVLPEWSQKLRNLSHDWLPLDDLPKRYGIGEDEEDLAYDLLIHLYRGVGEYFEILYRRRALLQEAV